MTAAVSPFLPLLLLEKEHHLKMHERCFFNSMAVPLFFGYLALGGLARSQCLLPLELKGGADGKHGTDYKAVSLDASSDNS